MHFPIPPGLQSVSSASLRSLSQETHPQLYFQDLLSYGEECLRQNQTQRAESVFRFLISTSGVPGDSHRSQVPPEIRSRARESLELLSGGGPWGRRLEFQAQRFLDGAFSPAMIVGMALGSSAFTVSRALIAPRLLNSSLNGMWRGGLMPRLVSSSLALGPEVGVFWLSSKSIREFLNPGTESWDWATNLQELGGLSLTLGLLKATGFAFGRGYQWASRRNPTSEAGVLARALAGNDGILWQQTGMFAGIALAHGIEIQLGWRPRQGLTSLVADSLITLTQFNVAGRVSQGLFPHLYAFNARLHHSMAMAENQQFHASMGHLLENFGNLRAENFLNGLRPAGALAGSPALRPTTWRGPGHGFIMMTQRLPEGRGSPTGSESFPVPGSTHYPESTPAARPTDIPSRLAKPINEVAQSLVRALGEVNLPQNPLTVTIRPLRNGELQINFVPGGHGSGRPQTNPSVDFSHVSSLLRELGWGPLLVRGSGRDYVGFRVLIPEFPTPGFHEAGPWDLGRCHPCWVNIYGQGPETSLESSLNEGFYVPRPSQEMAIYRALQELPGGPHIFYHSMSSVVLNPRESGISIQHRRMQLLHRILLGGRNIEEVAVTENGVGTIVDTTVTLAQLGARIKIKEPDAFSSGLHWDVIQNHFPSEVHKRVSYIPTFIDEATDMAYWVNPGPRNIHTFNQMGSGDYLGRDVRPGGLVIVQTDHHSGRESWPYYVHFHPHRWEKVFENALPKQPVGVNYAFPTAQVNNLYLQIYQKRSH